MNHLLAPTAIIATVAMLFSSVAPAGACTCLPTAAPDATGRPGTNADVIVEGTIDQLFARSSESDDPFVDLSAVVSVERYIKGSGSTVIKVDDPIHSGLCAFFDQSMVGSRYTLFLELREDSLRTNLCSGNQFLSGPTGGWQPADPADGDGLPREAFWALAIVLPITFLATATLVASRRP